MFTGIITDIGRVEFVEKTGDTRFTISTNYDPASVDIGASIACSGVCLTVIEKGGATGIDGEETRGWFSVEASGETLERTRLGEWERGTEINLERALKHGEEMGGHIVKGHVDGVADIITVEPVGDSHIVVIEVPEKYGAYIAEKGSITLEGVSLTVNEVKGNRFSINVIPHTWEFTTFKEVHAGSKVHFEIDVLARYAAKLIKAGHAGRLLQKIS